MAIWHKIGHWWYRMLLNYKTKRIIEINKRLEKLKNNGK